MGARGSGWIGALVVAWGCLVGLAIATGASVPYGFVDRKVTGGFEHPTDFAFFPGGDESKVLVLEKAGIVRYVENGIIQATPVLDLSDLVNNYLDRTVLSVTIDIDFYSGKPYIYLAYAVETGGYVGAPKTGQVARYTLYADGRSAVPGSKEVLLGTVTGAGCAGEDLSQNIVCCESTSHCVGGIEQTPDGILWITIGDGAFPQETGDGLALRAQNPVALNGKVLRIKRDGAAAEDNPNYSGDGSSNRSKIYGYGLRNGWRIHYDPPTGSALIADVGWHKLESVKLTGPNKNHGWPCLEGDDETVAYSIYPECERSTYPLVGVRDNPVEVYNRRIGISVSSAIRIPFRSWPAEYRDKIFYTDYGFNSMYYFGMNNLGVRTPGRTQQFASGLAGPVQVRLGSDDKLYYLSIKAQELRVISYEPDRTPPRIVTMSPANNANGIEMSTLVEVGLSKLVDETTLSDAIVVTKVSNNERITGTTEQIVDCRTIRFRPDMELDPNTEYRVAVANVRDPDGQGLSNPTTTVFTTGTGRTRFISDLPFLSERNWEGTGPVERDQSNGMERENDGVPIEIRGIRFEKGLGGIPLMEVQVTRPSECLRFQATVGVDDSSLDLDFPRAHFEVLSGTRKVYDSADVLGEPLKRTTPALDIDVDVSGAPTVTLRAVNGGTRRNNANLVSWGGARFRCGDFDDVRPTVTEVIPADNMSDVGINVMVTIRFSESMDARFFPNAVRIRAGTEEIGWTPQVNSETTQLTMLLEELSYDTEYVVSVSTEAKDRVGNRLAGAFETRFRTRLAPARGSLISLLELTPTSTGRGLTTFEEDPVEVTDPSSLVFTKGLGMRPWSRVEYVVPRRCSVLQAYVGVDRASNPAARCHMFIVGLTSNRRIFNGSFGVEDGAMEINVDVSSEERVHLTVRAEDRSISRTYCNWAAAKLQCSFGSSFLSNRTPTNVQNGPIFNDENARGARMAFATETDDRTLTFSRGIIARPYKKLTYDIPWRCSRVTATYGLSPAHGTDASMSFTVTGSGFTNCKTRKFIPGTKPELMSCNIRGASRFALHSLSGGDTVVDDVGVVGEPQLDCAVGSRKPTASIAPLPDNFVMNDEITFSGRGNRFNGAVLPADALSWTVVQHHCAPVCHTHIVTSKRGVTSDSFNVSPHPDYFFFEIRLRVCDPPLQPGESETTERCTHASSSVYPLTAVLTVDSEPSGLQLGLGSANGQGPIQQELVVGSTVSLSAIAIQGSHSFKEWSHNGSTNASTTVRIRNTNPRTFTARFESA